MDLRRPMRERRQSLRPVDIAAAAGALAAVIAEALPEVAVAARVGLYAAIRGELPVDLVECGGAERFLPVVLKSEGLLRFGSADGPRRPGAFGISEPVHADRSIGDLDVVLVPGLAFDRHGNRLGWGAGHYDRSLARAGVPQPFLIGVAYEFQVVGALDAKPWDVAMHAIATPERVIDLRRDSGAAR